MDYAAQIDTYILTLVKEAGSDLHLVAGATPAVRINGELISLTRAGVMRKEDTEGMLRQIISDLQFEKLINTKELDFAYTHRDEYRLRGNAYIEKGGIGIALRLIPKVKTFDNLNLPKAVLDFAHRKQGLFLVAGPVGSGKSTTLASMINDINTTETKNIITIEDPVEYIYDNERSIINQREIGFDTDSFTNALVSSFRQDIDVILIGEMRDADTMTTAVTAAETGHLVLSTLHTNSASQTIDRIIDMFPSEKQNQIRTQLASTLLGVISQRLLPRVQGGLIPAYELLLVTPAVQNLIREKRTHEIDNIIETSSEQGMMSMDRSLSDLVRTGQVPIDVAMKYARNPTLFQRLV